MRALFPVLLFLITTAASAQMPGCTDPLASNYNAAATVNDGSCTYAVAGVVPSYTDTLDTLLVETSGLLRWNNWLWTHNDDTDTALYATDTLTGAIQQIIPLQGVDNKDWEELTQDSLYFYIGDFGNNFDGARTDLHILRVSKDSLLTGNPQIDTIYFSYSDQVSFNPAPPDSTRFDCEAMIATADSLYLFTKQWTTYRTSYYALPKTPGTHVAQLRDSLVVTGLVTGATYLPDKKLVVLCGYNGVLQPFLYLLYDFNGTDFFGANKRRLSLSLPFHQVEGISTANGLKFTVTNERSVIGNITTPEQIHHLDLTAYLQSYYNQLNSMPDMQTELPFVLFPNPATELLTIRCDAVLPPATITICDVSGKVVMRVPYQTGMQHIEVRSLPAGTWLLQVTANEDGRVLLTRRWVKG